VGLEPVGQIGDGTHTNRRTPVRVSGLAGVTDVSAGAEHSMALTGAFGLGGGENESGVLHM
jgi:hypothetical protein